MSQRHLVAISASFSESPNGRSVRLNDEYVRAVEAAGLIPVLVPPLDRTEDVDEIADRVAGIVLTGGVDVDPERYGQPRHHSVDPPDARRDETEIALVQAARRRGMPLLGICRGCQVMNVAMGGTLVQDLASDPRFAGHGAGVVHRAGDRREDRVHDVIVDPASQLARAAGGSAFGTNSIHHQAPDTVGAGLRVVARAPDGVVEAVESCEEGWWAVGVQWHPEELTATREDWDRSLFAAFAAAAADYARRNGG